MSKIANDGLTRSGTGCFIAVGLPMTTVSVKGLNSPIASRGIDAVKACIDGRPIDLQLKIINAICVEFSALSDHVGRQTLRVFLV